MDDTSAKVAVLVAERHRQMTPDERIRIVSSMFDTARAIVESSLPPNLDRRERRLAYAQRMYGNDLPEAALIAFAEWTEDMTAAEKAARAGFDLSLIELSLTYSYDKRALQHQAALELALELERTGRELRDTSESTD